MINLQGTLGVLGTMLMWFSGLFNKLITNGEYAHPLGLIFMGIALLTIIIAVSDLKEKSK